MELSTGEEDAQDETIKRYVVLYWILFNDAVSVLFFLYLAFFFSSAVYASENEGCQYKKCYVGRREAR